MDSKGDVGLEVDLIFGLQNLIAIENHSKSSYNLTQDDKWLQLNDITRKIRTRWLQLIVKKENSEIWCITKHILASVMSLQEVANRFYGVNMELALDAEKDAYDLLCLLLELNDIKSQGGK